MGRRVGNPPPQPELRPDRRTVRRRAHRTRRPVAVLQFDSETVGDVRALLAAHQAAARLGRERLDDFVLAVSEVATNSIRHGDGHGTARVWSDGEALFCEITDTGYIVDPLVGRRLPGARGDGGHGLWVAHHLCDLVQLRSNPAGTTVRLSKRYLLAR